MRAGASEMRGALRGRAIAGCLAAMLFALSSVSVAAAGEAQEDIRDIRGPKRAEPSWLLPAILAGGAVLAVCAYGLWRRRRGASAPRALLPFEVALMRLEEIRALMLPARARDFGIAVSDIVRTYIEQRFHVIAAQRTTEEFLQDLLRSTNASLARHRPLLSEFLQQCDIVKFAGLSLAPQSMESLRQSALVFVRETAEPEVAGIREAPRANGKETRDSLPAA